MNQQQYQNIKQYIGSKLLNYILNYAEEQTLETSPFDSLNLNEQQVSVLEDLFKQIQSCRINFILQGGFGDGVEFYIRSRTHENDSLFNHYRRLCGGSTPVFNTGKDKTLAFLVNICIREYPNFLLKTSNQRIHSNAFINIGLNDDEQFVSLVKEDILDRLTNKAEGSEYAFQFSTECGLKFYSQVSTSCITLISRSFQNACNRMKYGLNDVIQELTKNLSILRELAENKEITFSSFIGIRGLHFEGFDSIELHNDSIIRQLDSTSNPSHHSNSIACNYTSNTGQYLCGSILEIKHVTRLVQEDAECTTTMTRHHFELKDKILNVLKFAIIFSLREDKGISTSFHEVGFPLVSPGNFSFSEERPKKYFIITQKHVEQIQAWYKHLIKTDLNNVKVPLKRLRYAIFERNHPEDSIVDAIIAWEGIFSEAFETTFKVTGSISKYLMTEDKREDFLSRIKKLYNLRSDLVHGKSSDLMKSEDIENLRSEVIKIGLDCLQKLLKDDVLLPLSPSERVKKIMIMS